MTSIDDLFKKPFLPSANGSTKRKFDGQDAEAAYKSAKLDPSVEDAPEDEDEDMEAGPEMPPDEDEDEEGRFFGSGTNQHTNAALDFVDRADDGADIKAEKIDQAWVRRLGLSFERKINKNSELRAKYESDPSRFVASEADLDAETKSLSILSEHPELYKDFAKIGCAASLVSLLSHENTDIAIDAIEIISELLDDDVEAEQEQWDALVAAMLEADLIDLLLSNLDRLDENLEADRSGVYHSLAVLESLSSNPTTADTIAQDPILTYLLTRISRPESSVSQNKQYAAEVLQVLSQASPSVRDRLISLDAIDKLLQLLAAYRKRDPPRESTEQEFAEDLFDTLTCLCSPPPGKQAFLAAEGTELMLLMLREAKFSKPRALKVLDHALSSSSGQPVAEKFIDAAGLKPLFSTFAKKNLEAADTEHILGIFSALLRLLPGESSHRIRLLAKFVEKEYEKLDKLVKLRHEYASKARVEDDIDAGAAVYCLNTLDVVLAWLAAEDGGARKRIVEGLRDRDEGLDTLKKSLQGQLEEVDTEEEGNVAEMLTALIECL
jgi:beta-catenin-like protein 1